MYIKQIFHAFLFNVRNCSPEVIDIQQRQAGLNITLPRLNNFNIKQNIAWNISFMIYPKHQTKNGWMLTRHKIFQWQYNYFFKKIKRKKKIQLQQQILNYLILIVDHVSYSWYMVHVSCSWYMARFFNSEHHCWRILPA